MAVPALWAAGRREALYGCSIRQDLGPGLEGSTACDPSKKEKKKAYWRAQCSLGIAPQSFFRHKYLVIHGLAFEYVSGQKTRIWLGGTI